MKLYKKISLICSLVLVVIVALCSTMLILRAKNNILELTYRQAAYKETNLASSFSEMSNYYSNESDSATTQYSLAKYCFSRFADDYCVLLTEDGETIASRVSIDPGKLLPLTTGEQQRYTGTVNDRRLLIVGSTVIMHNSRFFVYVVEDITPVYNDIWQMIWQFALIGIACIAVGTFLIILLVRRALKPLGELSKAAGRIAEGGYSERAPVHSANEVGKLASDFNVMAEAVEKHIAELTEMTERQQMFIGGVTHEFKTPLTTVILNADTLQNTYMDEDERQTALAYIERQCKWLERLTQKLLKFVTLKEHITVVPVSVQELFERAKNSMTETLHKRQTPLDIRCDADKKLHMDEDLMQSVLINLIDNASKASEPGQTVTLYASENTIEVRDQGSGISADELSRITEPFYMVDRSRSKKKGGSGLGLAIVLEIIRAHGGELEIESEPGKGTTVRVRLPE